jgi:hypothetical protein
MDYSIYKFYKGENASPENLDAKQARLWNAERVFDDDFKKNDSSDWYAFFKDCERDGKNAGEIFMKKLDDDENEKPKETSKDWIFGLWLDAYLFVDKFPKEWKKFYK